MNPCLRCYCHIRQPKKATFPLRSNRTYVFLSRIIIRTPLSVSGFGMKKSRAGSTSRLMVSKSSKSKRRTSVAIVMKSSANASLFNLVSRSWEHFPPGRALTPCPNTPLHLSRRVPGASSTARSSLPAAIARAQISLGQRTLRRCNA